MKSGGPWNLRGLRPEARDAARDAARQTGMSVGEWLNNVIAPDEPDHGHDMRFPERHDDSDDDGWRDDGRREFLRDDRDDYSVRPRPEDREPRRHRRDRERVSPRHFAPEREAAREREASREREAVREREATRHREIARKRKVELEREAELDRKAALKREADLDREAARERDAALEREAAREREVARERKAIRERELKLEREAALAREEFGEVHARLDRLTEQLERVIRVEPPRQTGAPQPHRGRPVGPAPLTPPLTVLPPQTFPPQPLPPQPLAPRPLPQSRPVRRTQAFGGALAIDQAVAEINQRQRALYGEAAPVTPAPQQQPPSAPSYAPSPEPVGPAAVAAPAEPVTPAAPAIDISNLSEQLRYITTRIESLRPTNDFEKLIAAIRKDLADIGQQITEALPRRAVESLEIEVQALAKRIDHSRGSGVDSNALAGLERGLAEVRDALRGLTPAESLVGFEDAVKTLTQKVDQISAKEDPAALQQLETAIGALRGIVAHVASNDTLTKVADDVRALAAKVDALANSAASGHAVSMLESRIDTLANALNASAEAGQALPREMERLLGGLIEKLEKVQLSQTDHTALGHLEDRIAQLIKRLDASDARLGNLQSVERGLADLLVHIDQMRASPIRGGDGDDIRRPDRRAKDSLEDSLETVHSTVEQVVGRLAMIESDIHPTAAEPRRDAASDVGSNVSPSRMARVFQRPAETSVPQPTKPRAVVAPADVMPGPTPTLASSPAPASPAIPLAAIPLAAIPVAAATPAPLASPPAAADPAPRRAAAPRKPIDPNLPPDHPLEPGFTAPGRAPSAAERIAASEAAADFAKPPVIGEPGDKTNFIAAARRAAQAAAAAVPGERRPRTEADGAEPKKSTLPLRKLLLAGGFVLVAFGCVHVALHMFQDSGSSVTPPPPSQVAPPAVLPETDSAKPVPLPSAPLVLPVPGGASDAAPGNPDTGDPVVNTPAPSNPAVGPQTSHTAPEPAAPAAPSVPARQSALHDGADVTGSLGRRAAAVAPPASIALPPAAISPAPLAIEKLPATIGGPNLRAAALAGDAAAEFEVATRFADGHDVPPSNEQAARWLERAAKQGLAPAQFRLGGLYEKGLGVKKDLAAARDLYMAAAEKGNAKAMHNLAVLYAEGINGPADYRTAAHWFRKAADHGITDSQYNLAILYARGIGVEQNYAESYKWFLLGANAGDSEAAKKRDEIATHLDPQSLAAAQQAVQKWMPEPQPDDAVNVKLPPGGWDPPAQAAKAKPRPVSSRALPDVKVN